MKLLSKYFCINYESQWPFSNPEFRDLPVFDSDAECPEMKPWLGLKNIFWICEIFCKSLTRNMSLCQLSQIHRCIVVLAVELPNNATLLDNREFVLKSWGNFNFIFPPFSLTFSNSFSGTSNNWRILSRILLTFSPFVILMKNGMPNVRPGSLSKCATGIKCSSGSIWSWSFGVSSNRNLK